MHAKTVINIKADQDVKDTAQKLAHDLGFSLSTIINAFLKQFIRTKEVHFSISPAISLELTELLGEVEKDIRKNKNISRVVSSESDLAKYLSSL